MFAAFVAPLGAMNAVNIRRVRLIYLIYGNKVGTPSDLVCYKYKKTRVSWSSIGFIHNHNSDLRLHIYVGQNSKIF